MRAWLNRRGSGIDLCLGMALLASEQEQFDLECWR